MGEEEADVISLTIEMIESGNYTEGILLTMATLAVAEEIRRVGDILKGYCDDRILGDDNHAGEFGAAE